MKNFKNFIKSSRATYLYESLTKFLMIIFFDDKAPAIISSSKGDD